MSTEAGDGAREGHAERWLGRGWGRALGGRLADTPGST